MSAIKINSKRFSRKFEAEIFQRPNERSTDCVFIRFLSFYLQYSDSIWKKTDFMHDSGNLFYKIFFSSASS